MAVRNKITIVGAGNVGATVALFTLMHGTADVCLIDVADGLAQGKALDMMHARCVEGYRATVMGTNDYADTAGSDIIVITAGIARKPGMSRDDLFAVNSKIVGEVVEKALHYSPDALLLCVTNPLDIMTYLAWKKSGLPAHRVFGMGGVLDSARFAHAISEEANINACDINACVLGAHGTAMKPMSRLTCVCGEPSTTHLEAEMLGKATERAINGGAEVVGLLKTGSAFYAPAASVAHMIDAILGDSDTVLPVCAYLDGQFGIHDVYTGVLARISRRGIVEIVTEIFNEEEISHLREAAGQCAEALDYCELRE